MTPPRLREVFAQFDRLRLRLEPRDTKRSKFIPHQGKREMARRLKRLAKSPLAVLAFGLIVLPVLLLADTSYNALNTPVTVDNNGALLAAFGTVGGGATSTRNLANSRLTLDSNGNLKVALAASSTTPVKFADGSAAAPAITFTSDPSTGLGFSASTLFFSITGTLSSVLSTAGWMLPSTATVGWSSTTNPYGSIDTNVGRNSAGIVGVTQLGADGADGTKVSHGDLTRQRAQYTITPASGGAGNCGTAFAAASLTADCTIYTLAAGQKLVGIYADVTVGFTCSGTCTGTKTIMAGKTAGGSEILTTGLSVVTTNTQFGLADTDLGTAMVRAAAIQGGYIPSWSATTPVIVRFTSGTGNWGSGAATFVNAGSVKFTLVTEQIK